MQNHTDPKPVRHAELPVDHELSGVPGRSRGALSQPPGAKILTIDNKFPASIANQATVLHLADDLYQQAAVVGDLES